MLTLMKAQEKGNKMEDMLKWIQKTYDQGVNDYDVSGAVKTITAYLKTAGEDTDLRDSFGRNLLHRLVENSGSQLVKVMLSCLVDINVQEGCGATPLLIATLQGNIHMITLLLDNTASLDKKRKEK